MDLDTFEKNQTIRVINHLKTYIFEVISKCLSDSDQKETLYHILNQLQLNVEVGKMAREREELRKIRNFVSIIDVQISFL